MREKCEVVCDLVFTLVCDASEIVCKVCEIVCDMCKIVYDVCKIVCGVCEVVTAHECGLSQFLVISNVV